MLVDGVLRILDMDTGRLPSLKETHKEALEVCRETGAILNFATSDINLFLENASDEAAEKIAALYPGAEISPEKDPGRYCIW
ncbi:hypothetical protein LCGC14_2123740 [marine sediment metagenome]|uniref:Uncharacterized protein n=1 Tax=marine sediment metagenome TaxID=412755 RepID=A0A0F9EQL8_9ZZZZ